MLRRRLPEKYEYEYYVMTVSYILEILEKLKSKLKIAGSKVSYGQLCYFPRLTYLQSLSGLNRLQAPED